MRYAAFFRGINVGGNHKVKMADLKHLLESCGFESVETVIQSGNVLFGTDRDPASLPGLISRAFAKRFGFESNAVVRSGEEIDALLAALPFTNEEIKEAEAADPDGGTVYTPERTVENGVLLLDGKKDHDARGDADSLAGAWK